MLARNDVLDRIKRRALEITADIERKLGPYRAEIVPGCDPLWHVAITAKGDNAPMKWLSERGFGCYSPCLELTSIIRGRKVTHQKPLFPGHIFIFVWDIKHHWRRIKACPGIARIMTVEERPVVVPFEAIYRMQAIEFSGMQCGPLKRKRRKKNRLPDVGGDEIISISPKSYWAGIETLDDDGRNRLLHEALGLTS